MKTVNFDDFKADPAKYMAIADGGEPLSVTSNNKILATLTPRTEVQILAQKHLENLNHKPDTPNQPEQNPAHKHFS